MTKNQKKLTKIISEIAKRGVGRNQKNIEQGYMYRGVDDVLNLVTPILADNGVYMRPFFTIENAKEIPSTKGPADQMIVKCELGLYDADAGDENNVLLETTTYGEARDRGDKCIMKAQTVALKYALIYAFGIPVIGTEGDPDQHTPDVEPTYNRRVGAGSTPGGQKPAVKSILGVGQPAAGVPRGQSRPVATPAVAHGQEQAKPSEQPTRGSTQVVKAETETAGNFTMDGLSEQQRSALEAMGIM